MLWAKGGARHTLFNVFYAPLAAEHVGFGQEADREVVAVVGQKEAAFDGRVPVVDQLIA